MIAVINASPLIYLSKIGALALLPKLFTRITTTTLVRKEVLLVENAPEHQVLKEAFNTWLETSIIEGEIIDELVKLQIHRGEAEVIALGKELLTREKNTVVIIDDLLAREIAISLGLKVTGTIGILLKALKEKIITNRECKKKLEQLITTTTFRLSAKLYAKILREINRMGE